MSFPTTALKYGWVYLTALGVITGTTIYVLNNTRQQVKPEDIIEIALGTYERCLATQTSTNPVIYSVAPTNLVQSWVKTNALVLNGTAYKVCYTSYWPSTTGVGTVQSYTSSVQPSINYAVSWTATNGWVWTNVSTWPSITVTDAYETVTNTIGWFPDRDYMISLDTTIKALVPYYVDTNTVYDGTTNIVMLTVTGLWASLGIGDHTNQFTRTPCWTNPISTNWIVNYTSYWPSTSGVITNICYTSDYRQVVNYAESWTATGGHVWVASSNWASEVVTVTNTATYDAYPWQIYVEDLQERYKVLNALKYTQPAASGISTGWYDVPDTFEYGSWNDAKAHSEANFTNDVTYSEVEFQCFTAGFLYTNNASYMSWIRTFRLSAPTLASSLNTSISHNIYFLLKPTLSEMPGTLTKTNGAVFDDNGLGLTLNTWTVVTNYPFGLTEGTAPTWCNEPTTASAPGWFFESQYTGFIESRGFVIKAANQKNIVDWQFNYCTNKYW